MSARDKMRKQAKTMRYTKTDAEELDIDSLLAELTEKQLVFWEEMNKAGATQVKAYRTAFDTKASDSVVAVDACRLWNSPKFSLIRAALMSTVRERAARSLEYRIAEMESFAERCEANGQFGAAFQARQAVGKLEGHYVDKKEITHKSDREALDALKAIAADGTKESIAFAMKEAKALGLEKELEKELGTVH